MRRRHFLYLAVLIPLWPIWPLVADAKPKRGDAWVLLEDADTAHVSGSTVDLRAARALQKSPDEVLLYVRRGGRAWVIRDAATMARLRAIWAPANELGKKMEAVGRKMEAVGSRQEEVGEKMRPLGERMGELGQDLASRRHDDPDVDRIRAEMDALSAKMDDLSRTMQSISKEMEPFSHEMERMGAEMEKLAKRAEGEQTVLIDAAIARGLAVEVK